MRKAAHRLGSVSGVDIEAERIVAASRVLSAHGWAPAGSGNYSHRRPDGAIAITVSGAHKARLTAGEVMTLGPSGQPMDRRRPSAETPLHLMIYRLCPDAQHQEVLGRHPSSESAHARGVPPGRVRRD